MVGTSNLGSWNGHWSIDICCLYFFDFPMNISIFDVYASNNKNNSVYSMYIYIYIYIYIHMSMSYMFWLYYMKKATIHP